MTRLVDALRALDIPGEVHGAGRWVTLEGERCRVHVVEAARGADYFTWCDAPAERTVERYPDPFAAIAAGLRRAAHGERDEGKSG